MYNNLFAFYSKYFSSFFTNTSVQVLKNTLPTEVERLFDKVCNFRREQVHTIWSSHTFNIRHKYLILNTVNRSEIHITGILISQAAVSIMIT